MTDHANIYMALSAAQAEMGKVVKGANNPHFKSKYADLADVMQVALPALNAHGIAAWHCIVAIDSGNVMRTNLSHGKSDTHIACDVPLLVQKNDMQGMKSATTYAKRIGIESLTGIAPEDDDGNDAAKAAPAKVKPQPATIPQEAIDAAVDSLSNAWTLDQLREVFTGLPKPVQSLPDVIAAKDDAKTRLTDAPAADLAGDAIPY